jgi:hypothetical protein
MGSWIQNSTPSGQYLGLKCDASLTYRCLNSNPGHFGNFTFILVHVENRVCLSRGVQIAGATWQAAMRIVAEVGDLVQRIEDGQVHVGYSVAGRSGGQGLYRAHGDEERGFLG